MRPHDRELAHYNGKYAGSKKPGRPPVSPGSGISVAPGTVEQRIPPEFRGAGRYGHFSGSIDAPKNVEPSFAALRWCHGSGVRQGALQAKGFEQGRAGSTSDARRPGEHTMRRDLLSTREGLACSREIRSRLGLTLRAIYEPDLAQDLPEHLADLLERLDKREPGPRRPPARSSRSA
jgi:hypothetical protein